MILYAFRWGAAPGWAFSLPTAGKGWTLFHQKKIYDLAREKNYIRELCVVKKHADTDRSILYTFK